ncbi:hypothetical protein EZJ55_07150 [Microcystis aeruginosa EAWAG127a]|uniref:Uncharacterized protein n=1 Tax=Microcystis aeruginosa EAWAG127a TaxID=2529855 RepID=A0A5J5M1S1_MICAE|nr:hypothetical protein EZJ55_07150 [Microcystis aeruginosa EAWAG127a]
MFFSYQLSVISYQLSDLSFKCAVCIKWAVLNSSFLLSFHCSLITVYCSLKNPLSPTTVRTR